MKKLLLIAFIVIGMITYAQKEKEIKYVFFEWTYTVKEAEYSLTWPNLNQSYKVWFYDAPLYFHTENELKEHLKEKNYHGSLVVDFDKDKIYKITTKTVYESELKEEKLYRAEGSIN